MVEDSCRERLAEISVKDEEGGSGCKHEGKATGKW